DILQAREVLQLNSKRLALESQTARTYIDIKQRFPNIRYRAHSEKRDLPEDDVEAAKAQAERETDPGMKAFFQKYAELGTPDGIARWKADLQTLEDQLYQANQPKPHEVSLTLLK
ncbi:MAG TPA: hypothetical protein VGM23_16865, partial [Armatimonadota bacterium]